MGLRVQNWVRVQVQLSNFNDVSRSITLHVTLKYRRELIWYDGYATCNVRPASQNWKGVLRSTRSRTRTQLGSPLANYKQQSLIFWKSLQHLGVQKDDFSANDTGKLGKGIRTCRIPESSPCVYPWLEYVQRALPSTKCACRESS